MAVGFCLGVWGLLISALRSLSLDVSRTMPRNRQKLKDSAGKQRANPPVPACYALSALFEAAGNHISPVPFVYRGILLLH